MSNIEPLIGQVFVQAPDYAIGKSSYHFESPENIYINFNGWGSKYPELRGVKKFTNVKFYPTNRVFVGTIDWATEGSYNGDTLWLYLMVFNKDYSAIERGYVTHDGKNKWVIDFSKNLHYINISSVSEDGHDGKNDGDDEEEKNSSEKMSTDFWGIALKFAKNVGAQAVNSLNERANEIRQLREKYKSMDDEKLVDILKSDGLFSSSSTEKGAALSELKSRGYSLEDIRSR